MSMTDQIPKTYDDAVDVLVEWHTDQMPDDLEIYLFPDAERKQVRLLEISDDFPGIGRIAAFPFGKSAEFPFKSSVAQVTHDEWMQICQGTLTLPSGWDLKHKQKVWPRE
jgi:hypothetical protein